jgi:hypothetical protein
LSETVIEDIDIAKAAISGVASPAMAKWHGQNVVDCRDGEVLADAPRRGPGGRVGIRDGARLRPINTMSDAVRAASSADAGEIETWAAASAAVSFRPSPTIRTFAPASGELRHQRRLLLRQGLGDDFLDTDARGEGLHGAARVPDRRITRRPVAFSAATVSAAPSRSVSVKRIVSGASSPIFRKVAVTSGASAPSHAARPSLTL